MALAAPHVIGIGQFTNISSNFSDQMALVAHLVGIDQLGYEKELGMTPCVSVCGVQFSHNSLFMRSVSVRMSKYSDQVCSVGV